MRRADRHYSKQTDVIERVDVAVISRPKKPQDSGNRAAFYW